jgi:hypothetical protein
MPSIAVFVCLVLLLAITPLRAQEADSLASWKAEVDTLALYDSLLNELQLLGLVGGGSRSVLDVNLGMGNGSFALQNSKYGANSAQFFYTAGLGYYHKSGLSLSGGLNVTSDSNVLKVYQGYVSPAYDFSSSSVAAGVSYYKYFNASNTGFYISPLVNEVYAYFTYRKSWLQPKIAFDYGWGTYNELANLQFIDTVRFRRLARLVRYLSQQDASAPVSDFSIIASVRHDFLFLSKKNEKNFFRYAPGLQVMAGTATYGTNTPLNSLNGPRLANLAEVRFFQENFAAAFAPPEQSFAFQNINLSQMAMYGIGKWYLQGQLVLSYILPKESAGWRLFFNVTTGIGL